MTWGNIFNRYLARGHDHGSAAYNADRWEERKKRMKINLTEDERLALVGALYSANETYRKCLKGLQECKGYARLEEQFERQINECAALIERLEEAA